MPSIGGAAAAFAERKQNARHHAVIPEITGEESPVKMDLRMESSLLEEDWMGNGAEDMSFEMPKGRILPREIFGGKENRA